MFGVGSIPWSPLGRGLLTRPFATESLRDSTDPYELRYPDIAASNLPPSTGRSMPIICEMLRSPSSIGLSDRDDIYYILIYFYPYRVEQLAKKKGISMAQVSTAWVLSKPHVTAPIVGTTSLEKLQDLIGMFGQYCTTMRLNEVCFLTGALDVELSSDEIKFLEEPYEPRRIAGHA